MKRDPMWYAVMGMLWGIWSDVGPPGLFTGIASAMTVAFFVAFLWKEGKP